MEVKTRWLRRQDVPSVNKMYSRHLVDRLINDTPAICLVCEVSDVVAGFIFYEFKSDSIWVHHFSVDEPFRKKGVGSLFIKALKEKLSRKRTKIEMEVSDEDLEVHLFLSKRGFIATAETSETYKFTYQD
jgi:GNAT superfamily N-acetyltransferase